MSRPPLPFPDPLQRVARSELQRLLAYRGRVEEQLGDLDQERARLKGELARIQERENLLGQIVDPTVGPLATPPGIVLRGARLRDEATRLLVQVHGVDREVYYRDWYKLVTDAGFVVLAKKPLATFLTGVSRSPVVERGLAAGNYSVNPRLLVGLEQELAEALAELGDLDALIQRDPNPSESLRTHKIRLTALVRRLERRVDEARRALASARPAAVRRMTSA